MAKSDRIDRLVADRVARLEAFSAWVVSQELNAYETADLMLYSLCGVICGIARTKAEALEGVGKLSGDVFEVVNGGYEKYKAIQMAGNEPPEAA